MRGSSPIFLVVPLLMALPSCKPDGSAGGKSQASSLNPPSSGRESCDVIVAGGSTAGVAAAIAAAREFEAEGTKDGRKRVACLLEPTDWAGGQLTSSGVSAVDFAHHQVSDGDGKLNLSRLTRDVTNNPKVFAEWMSAVAPASGGLYEMGNNPGLCWVSVRCYEPRSLVDVIHGTLSALDDKGYLKVFLNTVPKRVTKEGRSLKSLTAVRRTPKDMGNPSDYVWSRRLSTVLPDWYEPAPSANYDKETLVFEGPGGADFPVFVDGTEWGEVLVLSGASYLQGVESSEDTPSATNETCGQAIVYPLVVELKDAEAPLPGWWAGVAASIPHPQHYSINEPGRDFTWDDVWTYRRVRYGKAETERNRHGVPSAGKGDVSSQNWTLGNDYPYRYLFLPKGEAALQRSDWKGGVDVRALDEAERHALGWFQHLREKAPEGVGARLALSLVNGTANGLSKVPYIRDTRRSVGIGDFVLKYEGGILQGTRFDDSIAIGAYAADVHATKNAGCSMPAHVGNADHAPRPFELPFRAHTNKDFDNLLVAGKLMAQTFLANAATRLHPIEFSSGTGAGVAAAFMQKYRLSAASVVGSSQAIKDIQTRIRALHGPTSFGNLDSARE